MKKSLISTRFVLVLIILTMAVIMSACGSSTDSNYGMETEIVEGTVDKDSVGGDSEIGDLPQNAKIIRNVTIDGETKDFDSARNTIESKIAETGGYIENSKISGGESLSNGRRTERNAYYTIRIPAENLDGFIENAEGILNITAQSENTTDVTLDYYDIQSRLETLEAKKTALEGMLEKAENLSDMLTIQDNLYEVIADIEAYQSKLNLYDNKVSYSTVTLSLYEVVEYTVVDEEEPNFGERIKEAFIESWTNFGEFCQDFAVFLVSAMPILVFPVTAGLIVLIVWLVRRKKKDNNR